MGYKIIACDLDDTLLDDFGEISYKNKEAIQKLPIYGIKFILATGRTYKSVLPFYKALGLKTPVITIGGAQIYDSKGSLIYKDVLPPDTAHSLLEYGIKRNMHAQVYMGDDFQYLKECEESRYYANYTKLTGVEDTELLNKKIETSKVLFITDSKNAPYEIELLKKNFPELAVLRSKERLIEICSRHANKGNALKKLVDIMGYHQDEVAAIGDSTIDLSMLEYAALSAAPSSALIEVKANADLILGSNNDSCVAELIERHVL